MTILPHGLQQVFDERRDELLRYLRAHGAGDSAEDCLQELWIRISTSSVGPISSPRSYLFRMATNLMIDRRRAESQSGRRDHAWSALADRLSDSTAPEPGPERELDAKRTLEIVRKELASLPDRALSIFREHRIEGRTQRQIATQRGLSVSTIEGDLRIVYHCLDQIRRRIDEE